MSFKPLNNDIAIIAKYNPKVITDLSRIFTSSTNIYIDYANVIHWFDKLSWKINNKRLFNFLKSFQNVNEVKIYAGLLEGNKYSEFLINEFEQIGYKLITKKVKTIKKFIDTTSIAKNSPSILQSFVRSALLNEFDLNTIEFLNGKLAEINAKGKLFIEDRKCNFDVEMATDMLLDCHLTNIESFVVMSGDSDFADSINRLHNAGKQIVLFSTARKIPSELSELEYVYKFDINRIKDFICRKDSINDESLRSELGLKPKLIKK